MKLSQDHVTKHLTHDVLCVAKDNIGLFSEPPFLCSAVSSETTLDLFIF